MATSEERTAPEERPAPEGRWTKFGVLIAALTLILTYFGLAAGNHWPPFQVSSGQGHSGSRQGHAAGPSSSRSSTASDAGLPIVTITAPRKNAVVGPCTTVTFKSTGLPPSMAFVLGISIPQHNAWHFTADNLVQIAPDVWSKTSQSLGDASYGRGAPFIIGVYIMRKSELDALSNNETNPWDPSVPPADATRLARVSVVRNTHDPSCP
jgi:hypothetical protein